MLVHQAARESGQRYLAVRFGNVLGSRGSVVLTFKKQIEAGGPITVTHPEITRFFMTIPEAVQLTLQAAVLGQGGDVMVLDMGDPVKIADLARDLVHLSGLRVGEDVDIIFTGLRPGEKLYEELFIPGERFGRTSHEKIFVASNGDSPLPDHLQAAIQTLESSAQHDDRDAIVRSLCSLIPEFEPACVGVVPLETAQFRQVDPVEPGKLALTAANASHNHR
jgi:FlaA1/EpsC-like NDP-sugar epimerase